MPMGQYFCILSGIIILFFGFAQIAAHFLYKIESISTEGEALSSLISSGGQGGSA